jgi:hypothetical protein
LYFERAATSRTDRRRLLLFDDLDAWEALV